VRGLEILIRAAILLVLVGGGGTIAGFIARSNTIRTPAAWVLVAGLVVTAAILVWATVIGLWHLYLYFFTDRRPLGFFATTSKDDPGEAAAPGADRPPADAPSDASSGSSRPS
jgi:hypothetical protein